MNELDNDDIARYGRQMILPEIGMDGQVKIANAKVLIIGAGGLGCPSAQYLAAAGVGTIGIVDYDSIEISNLHRQVLHSEEKARNGTTKAMSIKLALQSLNSKIQIKTYETLLDRKNAIDIIEKYDVILDASDNATTRYLISDVCMICNKVLVSGSALRWEGQLTVYHYKLDNEIGPCYRCLYPRPPPVETITNCSDGGVLGVVPGIIGCYQALEAIKIILGQTPSYHQKLLVFDGLSGANRTVKLRPRKLDCIACGVTPTITKDNLPDYEGFCGASANDKCINVMLLSKEERISAQDYKTVASKSNNHVLIDVRNPVELTICSLPNSINIPYNTLKAASRLSNEKFQQIPACSTLTKAISATTKSEIFESEFPIYVVCKNGNDSQKAINILQDKFQASVNISFKDIKGGLTAWATNVDKQFPLY